GAVPGLAPGSGGRRVRPGGAAARRAEAGAAVTGGRAADAAGVGGATAQDPGRPRQRLTAIGRLASRGTEGPRGGTGEPVAAPKEPLPKSERPARAGRRANYRIAGWAREAAPGSTPGLSAGPSPRSRGPQHRCRPAADGRSCSPDPPAAPASG